jgi:hypothetical protein
VGKEPRSLAGSNLVTDTEWAAQPIRLSSPLIMPLDSSSCHRIHPGGWLNHSATDGSMRSSFSLDISPPILHVLHGIGPPSPCAPQNWAVVTLCSTELGRRRLVLHRINHHRHEFHRVGGRTLVATMKPNRERNPSGGDETLSTAKP